MMAVTGNLISAKLLCYRKAGILNEKGFVSYTTKLFLLESICFFLTLELSLSFQIPERTLKRNHTNFVGQFPDLIIYSYASKNRMQLSQKNGIQVYFMCLKIGFGLI